MVDKLNKIDNLDNGFNISEDPVPQAPENTEKIQS